jgi:Flp pilus assembly protein TadG
MSRKSRLFSPIRAPFKKFRRADDASVIVEFAFVAPVFFLLVFTFIETAAMMFQEYAMQAGVHEASRMIRTGQAQNSGWTAGNFKAKTCEVAKIIPDCTSKIKVYVNSRATFAQMQVAAPAFNAVGASATGTDENVTFTCGTPQQVVAVIATYDHVFILPIMRFFANTSNNAHRRLTAAAMFRNEPFSASSNCGV